jgi:hypothetical protein
MPTLDPRDIDPAYQLHIASPNTIADEAGVYQIVGNSEYQNSVSFICQGEEMLRLSSEGFYIRGKKIEQDAHEANLVYNSFKEWLSWQHLTR